MLGASWAHVVTRKYCQALVGTPVRHVEPLPHPPWGFAFKGGEASRQQPFIKEYQISTDNVMRGLVDNTKYMYKIYKKYKI